MGGGIGSRFWPFSRESYPKQFLDFFGTGRSLLQMTFDRFSKIIPIENIYIVTNEQYASLVKEQLPELGKSQILLEPARRNTAPCIAYAAYHIKACNPNANIVVAPSDHLILKEDIFLKDVQKSLDFVKDNNALVTLGIKPSRPETGYGYIQISPRYLPPFRFGQRKIQHSGRTRFHRRELPLLPEYLHRLRDHGKSGQRIYALC